MNVLFAIFFILQGCASNGTQGQPTLANPAASSPNENMSYMYRSPSPAAVSALGLGR